MEIPHVTVSGGRSMSASQVCPVVCVGVICVICVICVSDLVWTLYFQAFFKELNINKWLVSIYIIIILIFLTIEHLFYQLCI